MSKDRKTGPFSGEDDKIIRLGIRNGWNDEEIAEKIGRTLVTVRKYITKRNLRHRGSINIDQEDVTRLKEELRKRPYYGSLLQMYGETDLCLFETMWIDFVAQFNSDILPTEELSLTRLIHTRMALDKNRKDNFGAIRDISGLQEKLLLETQKPTDQRNYELVAELTTQIDMSKGVLGSFNTELRQLSGEESNILKELKASREMRIKKVEDSKTAFSGYVRYLDEEPNLKQVGRDAELMRKAMERSMDKLGEYHLYINDRLDRPFLTNETINKPTKDESLTDDKSSTNDESLTEEGEKEDDKK